MRKAWKEIGLEDLEKSGVIKLGRGDVISKKDMQADPGPNPVYSSAENKNGMIGKYSKFMFDEELITWSVDGGGHIFYRPKHKFSVTNIGGWLRILDNKVFTYRFLTYALQRLHKQHSFDWQNKAHPSVIRKLYTRIPMPSIPEQRRIVDLISSVDSYIEALQQQLESAQKSRNALLHELLTAGGDSWSRAGLSEVCTMIKRGQAPSYTEQKSVTVLNQKCIRHGQIQFEFARQTDSNVKPINEWAYLRAEDTLVNSTGVGTLGRAAFVGIRDEPLTVDSHLTIVRADKNKIHPSFLGLSLHFREADIEALAAGSSGQTELSREALGNLIITIPPLPEQKRIVEIISSMDNVVDQSQTAIEKVRNLRSGLLSDLLSGEHEIPSSYDKQMSAA